MADRYVILMAGMPGAGKSTIALALGAELGIPVIDKDVIVSALLEEGQTGDPAHAAAYWVTFDIVEHMVRTQKMSVIVDTPAGLSSTVDWALRLCEDAGAHLIPVLCSADGRTRYDRMAAREGLRSHSKGTSRTPGTARDRFGHLPPDTIEIDTMGDIDEVIQRAIAEVSGRLSAINLRSRNH